MFYRYSFYRFTGTFLAVLWLTLCVSSASAQWTQTAGPEGGQVRPIAAYNATTLFAGLSTGVWKTTDNGATWSFSGLQGEIIYDMLVKGTDVFAAGYSTLYRSTDAGATWNPTAAVPGGGALQSLLVGSTGDLFVGSVFGGGMHRSTNNGATWIASNTGLTTTQIEERAMVLVGTDIYAGTRDQGVFKSTNNGATWAEANGGVLGSSDVFQLASNGTRLYAAAGQLYVSTNGGTNWSVVSTAPVGGFSYKVAATGSDVYVGTLDGSVIRSTNNGATWTAVGAGPDQGQNSFLLRGASEVFVATDGAGVYYSSNKGASWTQQVSGIRASIVETMVKKGDNLYAGTYHNGLLISTNNGTSWTPTGSGVPPTARIITLALKSDLIFVGSFGNGVYKSTDNGASWTAANTGLNLNVRTLESRGTELFAGTDNGVYRSINDGANWTQVNGGGSLANTNITAMGVNGSALFVGTASGSGAGIYRTTNSGTTWTLVSTGLPAANPAPFNGYIQSILFIGTDFAYTGINGAFPGCYKTTNNGASWTAVSGIGQVSSLSVGANAVFAGVSGNGVFASTDGGTSFNNIGNSGNGLFNLSVNAVAAAGPNLVAGTNGSGLFTYDISSTIYWSRQSITGNRLNGVAANSNATVAVDANGNFYYSTDNGATFTPQNISGSSLKSIATAGNFGATLKLRSKSTYANHSRADVPASHSRAEIQSGQSPTAFGTAISCGVGGTILRTEDDGATWTVENNTGNDLNCVALANDFSIVNKTVNGVQSPTAFGTAISCGVGGTILRSTDGGDTWTSENNTGNINTLTGVSIDGNSTLARQTALAAQTGNSAASAKGVRTQSPTAFGTAISCGVGGTILRSTDGGDTWIDESEPAETADLSGVSYTTDALAGKTGYGLQAVSVAIAVGKGGTIRRSTDDGVTWTTINSGTSLDLFSVKMVDGLFGFISGERGLLLKTLDGGLTWFQNGSPTSEDMLSLTALPGGSAFAAGTGGEVIVTGSSGDVPLPVELSAFTGQASTADGASAVRLEWITASEKNNAGFTLLRDGNPVASYESVPALRGNGTTTAASAYSFTDADVVAGQTYTYTLRSTDFGGAIHDYRQSVTMEVRESTVAASRYELLANYPNPFNPTTVIRFTMQVGGQATIRVYDMLGRTVRTETLNAAAGLNSYRFTADNLSSGLYFYQLTVLGSQSGSASSPSGSAGSQSGFTQTRKMLLIK